MNQCIINVVEKSVFVAFNQIIESGYIEVWSLNEKTKPLKRKKILNSNFKNIETNLENGKYRLEIFIDGEQITKTITIN